MDVAKGLGILLVFAGHSLQTASGVGFSGGQAPFKLIYSFHMPLFFFMSGFVGAALPGTFTGFVNRQLRRRLIPLYFFNIAVIPLWMIATFPHPIAEGATLVSRLASGALSTVVEGRPAWNHNTWFLACLLTVEVWHFAIGRWLTTPRRLCLSMALFASLYLLMSATTRPSLVVRFEHAWYINAAVIAIVFWQCGVLLRRTGWFDQRTVSKTALVLVCTATLALLIGTFDCNRESFDPRWPFVLMKHAQCGNPGWFCLTAFAGILTTIAVSHLLAPARVLQAVGRISLPLFCLNGVLFAYVDPAVLKLVRQLLPSDAPWVTASVVLIHVAVSISACVPLVLIMKRLCPWALGQTNRAPARALPGECRKHGVQAAPTARSDASSPRRPLRPIGARA